jgi:hypothetical protein
MKFAEILRTFEDTVRVFRAMQVNRRSKESRNIFVDRRLGLKWARPSDRTHYGTIWARH